MKMQQSAPRSGIDPVTFEIVRNSLVAVSAEMALVVVKSAYSPAVNEGMDFASTISDRDGNLVAQSEFDLPAFVGLSMLTVKEVIRQIGLDRMAPGDIYLINDPYVASTHCNDVHFVRPIFYQGERVAFLESTAHWSDVGGPIPSSLNSMAHSHFEEGLRIPAVKIVDRDELRQDLLSLLLTNMRLPWERMGDLNAQCAALRTGDARLQAIIAKHGLETVHACMAEMQNASERMIRAALRQIPDGTYVAEDYNDRDLTTGRPIRIRVKLIISADHALFDLTESDDAVAGAVNTSIVSTTSSIFTAVGAILPPVPMNAGVMRAVEVKARPGSICHARPPSAVSTQGATMEIIIAAASAALSQAVPQRGAGTCSTVLNTVYAGFDERPGFEASFLEYVWSVGGMGATQTHDGPNVVGSAWAATIQNIPVELQERRFPLVWRHNMLRPDSGGPGCTRGGLGLLQIFALPFQGGTLTNFGNRERFGPPGIFKGDPGGTAGLVLNHGTEHERAVGLVASNVPVRRGETVSYWSAGGGGYGDPLERPVAKVLEDIKDEYVSLAAARSQYGVIVREIDRRRLHYVVDHVATETLRRDLRAAQADRRSGDR